MRAVVPSIALALLLAACGQGGGNQVTNGGEPESNLSTSTAPTQDLATLLGNQPRLVTLVKAAGMEKVLSGKEPYTILAPNDAALDALPAGTLDRLQKPEGRAELTALLRAHILPGTILAADLKRAVDSGNGKATLATMAGDPLTVTRDGDGYRITDASGKGARVLGTEQLARNGVIHPIDAVLPAPSGQ